MFGEIKGFHTWYEVKNAGAPTLDRPAFLLIDPILNKRLMPSVVRAMFKADGWRIRWNQRASWEKLDTSRYNPLFWTYKDERNVQEK